MLIGKAMKELAPEIARMGKSAPKVLGELGRGIKSSDKAYLKNIAFRSVFVKGSFSFARRVGISQILKLLRSKHRVGPVTLIAIIAYLESELDAGRLFAGIDAYDKAHNEKELRKLYVKSIPAIAAGDRNYSNFIANAHGAQFQLMQIAILHGMHQLGDPKAKVVGIEVPRSIAIFSKENDLDTAVERKDYISQQVTDYGREIDIVTGTMVTGEIWREMKSYKAQSKTNLSLRSSITPWKWNSGKKQEDANDQNTKGNTPHRQFILDRVAFETFARARQPEQLAKSLDQRKFNIALNEIYWHFHDFETKTTISPSLSKIKTAFRKEASGGPDFYDEHVAEYDADIFIMGNIDLFLTNANSNIEDAVRAEVAERISDIVEETAP